MYPYYNNFGVAVENPPAVTGGVGQAPNTQAVTLPLGVSVQYPSDQKALVYGVLAFIAWRLLK